MLGNETCETAIPLLYALLFGTDGACIDLSTASIVALAAGFMAGVMALQFLARQLLRLVLRRPPGPRRAVPAGAADSRPYDGGPIRSARPR